MANRLRTAQIPRICVRPQEESDEEELTRRGRVQSTERQKHIIRGRIQVQFGFQIQYNEVIYL